MILLDNYFLSEFHLTLLLILRSMIQMEIFKSSKLVIKLIALCWKLLIFSDMTIVKSENKMNQTLFKSFPSLQRLKQWVQLSIIRVNNMFLPKEPLIIFLRTALFTLMQVVMLNLLPKHSRIPFLENSNNSPMVLLELF